MGADARASDPPPRSGRRSSWLTLGASLSLGWDPDGHPGWVERMFETWLRVVPALAPSLADYGEPPRVPFRPDDLAGESRRLGWGWCAKRPDARLRADTAGGGARNHATLSLDGRGRPETAPDLAELVDALAGLLRPDWGFVHALTRAEVLEAARTGRPDLYLPSRDGARPEGAGLLAGSTVTLREGLPTLYWRNYFGLPYLELLGPALERAPWARLEQVAGGVVRADVTWDPPTEDGYGRFVASRAAVVEALGSDLFAPRAKRVPRAVAEFTSGRPPDGGE